MIDIHTSSEQRRERPQVQSQDVTVDNHVDGGGENKVIYNFVFKCFFFFTKKLFH